MLQLRISFLLRNVMRKVVIIEHNEICEGIVLAKPCLPECIVSSLSGIFPMATRSRTDRFRAVSPWLFNHSSLVCLLASSARKSCDRTALSAWKCRCFVVINSSLADLCGLWQLLFTFVHGRVILRLTCFCCLLTLLKNSCKPFICEA